MLYLYHPPASLFKDLTLLKEKKKGGGEGILKSLYSFHADEYLIRSVRVPHFWNKY